MVAVASRASDRPEMGRVAGRRAARILVLVCASVPCAARGAPSVAKPCALELAALAEEFLIHCSGDGDCSRSWTIAKLAWASELLGQPSLFDSTRSFNVTEHGVPAARSVSPDPPRRCLRLTSCHVQLLRR